MLSMPLINKGSSKFRRMSGLHAPVHPHPQQKSLDSLYWLSLSLQNPVSHQLPFLIPRYSEVFLDISFHLGVRPYRSTNTFQYCIYHWLRNYFVFGLRLTRCIKFCIYKWFVKYCLQQSLNYDIVITNYSFKLK